MPGTPRPLAVICIILFIAFMIVRQNGMLPEIAHPILQAIPSSINDIPAPSQPHNIYELPSNSKLLSPCIPSLSGPPVLISSEQVPSTYPRALKLRNGTLLASYTIFSPQTTLLLSSSHDLGLTWQSYSQIYTVSPTSHVQLNNAFLLQLPSGRLLCSMRAHDMVPELEFAEEKPGGENENYAYYRLMIYYSDDIGRTWKYLSTPVEGKGPMNGLWEPFMRVDNKGDLQFYYSMEVNPRDQDNLVRTSQDGGLTWSDSVYVSGEGLKTRDGMMGIQEVSPGSGHLIAVFESVEEKGEVVTFEARFEIFIVTSHDDGKSWGERKMIAAGLHGDLKRNAGAPQIALVGEILVVSFMTDEERLEGMWHRNAFIKIILSADGGKRWGNKLVVADMPAAWAGLLAVNDTSFLVLCEHEDHVEAQRVTLS